MIPVDQDRFSSHEDPTQMGNCFSAAIASILELPLQEVPFFRGMPDSEWYQAFCKFLTKHGYGFAGTFYKKDLPWENLLKRTPGVNGYFVVGGSSPRGFVDGHAVVYDRHGKMVHDPHFSRAGITKFRSVYMIEPLHIRLTDEMEPHLDDDLLTPAIIKWRDSLPDYRHAKTGHCYVASEVMYHLYGKYHGYTPHVLKMGDVNHWFLKKTGDKLRGEIIDSTVEQFLLAPIPYEKSRGTGFLTKGPSKRAKILMKKMGWE